MRNAAALAAAMRRMRHHLRTDESHMRAYGALYLRYEDHFYFWEFLVIARKVLLVAIAKLLSHSPAAQIACVLVVLVVALLLQLKYKPFLSDDIDRVERGLLGGCVAVACLGVWSQYGAASDAKGMAVTVAYFAVLALAALAVAAPMRSIWRGNATGGDSDAEAPQTETGAQGHAWPVAVAVGGAEVHHVRGGRAQPAETSNPLQITRTTLQVATGGGGTAKKGFKKAFVL